ncbi:MAG: glutamate--tRNA ligase [Candidatus Eremiobacteraeota bacterium]|nr:glutamate--tRNA ligase [Candidatus Eremiobacteraeota bacterium]
MVRVRFAPSPTGYLHVGGLRTALYNFLLARQQGGKFLLRVEDTDRNRYVEGAVESMIESLGWAGIAIDEGVGAGGELGPYTQSERLDIYRQHVEILLEKGHAYYCFATPEELQQMRDEQTKANQMVMYDRRYRDYDPAQAKERVQAGEKHVVRMKIPDNETVVIDDLVRGEVKFDTALVDDQVLLKNDGFPTYHLAAVVDDHLMEITHVIRGEEWLTSTPKHLLLYRFFGWDPPRFAHLPLIVNQQKKKLSKRDGDVSVEAYREKGYLPLGLVNFLALLGWNAGDDKEFYASLEELSQAFAVERVHKSSAVFDFDKLKHINFLHMRATPSAELRKELVPFFARAGLEMPSPEYLDGVIELMRERASLLTDLVEGARYFYEDPTEFDAKTLKKRWKDDSPELLKAYADALEDCEWKAERLEEVLRSVCEAREAGAGRLIHPARLAVSGVGGGPGLFEMLELIGREACLRRMRKAADQLVVPQ